VLCRAASSCRWDIDQAQAKAKYDNGVLTLTLPKKLTNGSQRLTIE
jgi:HSP20 family protein